MGWTRSFQTPSTCGILLLLWIEVQVLWKSALWIALWHGWKAFSYGLLWTGFQPPCGLAPTHSSWYTGWNLWPLSDLFLWLFQTCCIWIKKDPFPWLPCIWLTWVYLQLWAPKYLWEAGPWHAWVSVSLLKAGLWLLNLQSVFVFHIVVRR